MTEFIQGVRGTAETRVLRLREAMEGLQLDAVIATDVPTPPQPSYARHLSGLYVPDDIVPINFAVIVTMDGQTALIAPPGVRKGIFHLAQAKSWITDVVLTEYVDEPAWEIETGWGFYVSGLGGAIGRWLADSGAAQGRVGIAGQWDDFDQTAALLPEAQFEPTLIATPEGRSVDLLQSVLAANTPWEISRMERAQIAADAAIRSFVDEAKAGASVREARVAAQTAALRVGADRIVLAGPIGLGPWTMWDWADPVDQHFVPGGLYFVEVVRCGWLDVEIQCARSFVVGEPSRAQTRVVDTCRRTIGAIYDALEIGSSGDQLWRIGLEEARRGGCEPWSLFGHQKSVLPSSSFAITANEVSFVYEGQSIALHACLRDVEAGESGMIGDTVVIENGRWRHLSEAPLSYDLK